MSQITATIVGNTTAEPELRFTTGGRAVCNFSLAHTPRRMVDGQWTNGDAQFFDVEAWGTLAENLAESVTKGMRLVMVGAPRHSSWEDKETGAKRSRVIFVAEAAGPDLTWATATVTKSAKNENGSSNGTTTNRSYVPAGGPLVEEEPF